MQRNLLIFTAISLFFLPHAAAAQNTPRLFSNPARIDLTRADPGPGVFQPSPDCRTLTSGTSSLRRTGSEVALTLDITWSDPAKTTIYNPLSRTLNEPERDHLRVRSYNGCLTGPVVEVLPSQTVRWTLNNKLGAANTGPCPAPDHTEPNCYNNTNLHTHGLHVSPTGNSDNVFINLPAGEVFEYEHNIPADHPAGTFWYHAHRHGSTAIQVSSGMAGALIVRGRRTIQQKRAHQAQVADIDTILRDRTGNRLQEKVLVFQQIAYGCFDPNNPQAPFSKRPDGTWNCPQNFTGEVRDYATQLEGVQTWDNSGRFTAVNGEVLPRMGRDPRSGGGEAIRAGEIMRWRMIHAGIRDAVPLQIVRVDRNAARQVLRQFKARTDVPAGTRMLVNKALPSDAAPAPSDEMLQQLIETAPQGRTEPDRRATEQLVKDLCATTNVVPQVELAVDGLTRQHFTPKNYNILQPGYRSDVLVAFPEPGLYCVLALSVPPAARPIVGAPGDTVLLKSQDVLMTVRVESGRSIPAKYAGKTEQYVIDQLLTADRAQPRSRRLPADVRERIARNDLSDYAFKVAFDVPAGPVRTLGYHVRVPGPRFVWNISTATPQPAAEDHQYGNPGAPVFQPRLGTMETWNVLASSSHVHHIHVNPFEIVDVHDQTGKSIFDPDGACAAPPAQTSVDADLRQYCDQKGVLRDTIFIRANYKVVIRTRYERYIGQFVLHCHILDHEDQGMMADVNILAPGDTPRTAGTAEVPHTHR